MNTWEGTRSLCVDPEGGTISKKKGGLIDDRRERMLCSLCTAQLYTYTLIPLFIYLCIYIRMCSICMGMDIGRFKGAE